ncbi:MAG: hypothetical protein WA880_09385, partial [Ornithinimicrobium sp.]
MRRLLIVLATVLALAGPLSTVSAYETATSAPVKAVRTSVAPPAFGAHFHGGWNYGSESQMTTALRSLKRAGGTWVRID